MQDVEDEPLFAERVAGIDIAKAGIEVAVRVPSDTTAGRRQQEIHSFRTTRNELLALADWLRSWGVAKVGMESTSVTGSRCTSCWSGRASTEPCIRPRRSRRCPGGEDKQDAVWIAKITERAACPPASCLPRTSAGSGPIPVTAAP
jgi:transposase